MATITTMLMRLAPLSLADIVTFVPTSSMAVNADQTLMARAEYKHMEKFLSPAEEKCDYLILGHRSCPSAIANKETERAVKLVQSITQKFCRKKKEKKKPGL
jgi:hypothetical protein